MSPTGTHLGNSPTKSQISVSWSTSVNVLAVFNREKNCQQYNTKWLKTEWAGKIWLGVDWFCLLTKTWADTITHVVFTYDRHVYKTIYWFKGLTVCTPARDKVTNVSRFISVPLIDKMQTDRNIGRASLINLCSWWALHWCKHLCTMRNRHGMFYMVIQLPDCKSFVLKKIKIKINLTGCQVQLLEKLHLLHHRHVIETAESIQWGMATL